MRSQLEIIEPGSYKNYLSYISKGYNFFQISMDKLLGRNFYHLFEFVKPGNIPLLINLKTYITHRKYVKRFFRHPDLRRAFTFQNIYVGQSPNNSPALFTMLPAVELSEGALFPVGGMFRIVEKLTEIAGSLGVQFYFNSRVDKILVSKNSVESILMHDGSVKTADLIVVNADLPYAYSSLLPDKRISSRINKMKFACSALVFHWALDKVYPGLEHHNVFLSENYDHNLYMIFNKKSIAENPSFYVHSPARTDPSAAPAGGDSLTIIVPAGHIDEKNPRNWDSLKKTARASIINRLKRTGMEDIENHIKFEMCYTPNRWESIYNVSRGSVFGSLSHSILQMGYFRPHNRHDRYRNLFFVGGSTHPGNGIPLVLLSAKLTSERILKETGNI
jgi:phytoene desaturase